MMIKTAQIPPSAELAPYIRCYAFREFDTKGADLTKAWHASGETAIPFFFKALPVKLIDTGRGKILKAGNPCGVVGLSSQYNGEMTFNGSYAFFEIVFKPNGFYKIFKIPVAKIIDQIVWADEILDRGIKLLHEQLCSADGLVAMGKLANACLLNNLNKQKSAGREDAISISIHSILKNAGQVDVGALAYDVNMSIRNFERRFSAEIGLSPKLFSCITRFNYALNLKLVHPAMNWTSIAYQSGYFDQMHLIKDFKKFSGASPATFIEHAPMTKEEFESRVDGYS